MPNIKFKKTLNNSQKMLLETIKKMPLQNGVIITTSAELQEKLRNKDVELSIIHIPRVVRLLVTEGFLKNAEAVYFKNVVGRRMQITLIKNAKKSKSK